MLIFYIKIEHIVDKLDLNKPKKSKKPRVSKLFTISCKYK